ncbi:MAG: hypothetical protein WC489_06300 [Patescibacteria group bacterium]|jgi:ribosomal protein L19E
MPPIKENTPAVVEAAIALGISENDLDISQERVEVCLKCKQCRFEQHMTLEEYFNRYKKEGKLRCPICPRAPELHFYKTDMRRIRIAGFNTERERQGISKEEMVRLLKAISGGELDKRKRLSG